MPEPITFTPEEKEAAFDKLAEMFFDRNFGTASKSDIELFMFSVYMDKHISMYADKNGALDYNECSDYEMGKKLGITQERVRALKLKKQARYPVEYDWVLSLERLKENIRYDEPTKKIVIPVPDPNLYNEIRHFIETHGGYIEIKRGQNTINIRPEYFFMLFMENLNEKEKEKCRKDLVDRLNEANVNNADSMTNSKLLNSLSKTENKFDIILDIVGEFLTISPLAKILIAVLRDLVATYR